jgi:AcrR family transcriptional regulator
LNAAARSEQPQDSASRTCEKLLDAAENLFTERGFAATSIRDITVAAGCNIAAVNYHFRSKEALYREVFRRRLTELRELRILGIERAVQAAGRKATLEHVIRSFAEAFLEPFVDADRGARLMRMWSWELIDPHLPPGTFIDEMMEPVRKAFIAALAVTCPDIGDDAARHCVASIIGQLVHAVQLRRFDGSARSERKERAAHAELVNHVVRFSAAGVRASRR